MAKVLMRLDDVVLALKKGKNTVADSTTSLVIPASQSSTGAKRNLKLDVSDEGLSLLKAAEQSRDKILEDAKQKYEEGMAKLKAEREKSEASAWKDLNAIADKLDEIKPRRKPRNSAENQNESASESQSSEEAPQRAYEENSYQQQNQW